VKASCRAGPRTSPATCPLWRSRLILYGLVGKDQAAAKLKDLLDGQNVGCRGLISQGPRHTSIKTRIVAHQQQVVRLDRERAAANRMGPPRAALLAALEPALLKADAVIVGELWQRRRHTRPSGRFAALLPCAVVSG